MVASRIAEVGAIGAAVGVIGLVLLGVLGLRGSQPLRGAVAVVAWPVAGILHYLFVAPLGGWGFPVYAVLGVALFLAALGWYCANSSSWPGWVVPLFCCPLALGGLGYLFGELAAPRRFGVSMWTEPIPRPPNLGPVSCWNGRLVVEVKDLDTGEVWVGATNKDRLAYYEWYSNRAAGLGALIGLVAGAAIARFRVVPPSNADRIRKLFLEEFPAERPSKESGEKSNHVRRSLPDITREPPGALTDPDTASER
jgi:hypothetical protein